MPDNIIQLSEQLIKTELKELARSNVLIQPESLTNSLSTCFAS